MDPRGERFTSLVEIVGEPVRRFLIRRAARVGADPDDALAEVFLVLWRRLDDVPEPNPLPWCYRVAANVLANAARSAGRRRALTDKVIAIDPPRPVPAAAVGDHPEVHAALATLSELDREIVTLWAWDDLAPAGIAEVLELTPNAVSVRLTRIKKALREELERRERIAGEPDTDGV